MSHFTFNQNFSSSAGFVFNNNLVEFISGLVRQRDKAPPNSLYWATYTTDINLNVSPGGGSLIGTGTGSPVITNNRLDLTGNLIKYVDYNAASQVSQQVGAVKFKFIPDYNGSPLGDKNIYNETESNLSSNNQLLLRHQASDSSLRLIIRNSSSIDIVNSILGVWSPTSGSTYEIEINFDITSGATRLFINGIQFGTTQTDTGTRDSNIGLIRIGSNNAGSSTSDFYIEDLIRFSKVQHTANYTPGYTLQEYRYVESKVQLPRFTNAGIGNIKSFTNLETVESGSPRQVWNDKYWNGSAWVTSNGTYNQASSKAGILTGISSFPLSDTLDIYIIFPNAVTSSNISNLIVTYTAPPNTCTVYGTTFDGSGQPISGVNVKMQLVKKFPIYNSKANIDNIELSTISDQFGDWNQELIETTRMNSKWKFKFIANGRIREFIREVPDQNSAFFGDLQV